MRKVLNHVETLWQSCVRTLLLTFEIIFHFSLFCLDNCLYRKKKTTLFVEVIFEGMLIELKLAIFKNCVSRAETLLLAVVLF